MESPASQSAQTHDEFIKITIGGFGKYQFWVCFMVFLTKVPIAFHQMAIIFLAPPPKFVCQDDGQEKNKCPCNDISYDRSVFKETIITKWDLVCGRAELTNLTQMLTMFGLLLGSIVFGALSDRFGRRPPLIGASLMQLVCGLIAGFCPEFWSFTFFRFLVGCATGGTMVVGYVLLMEFIGKEYREIVSAVYQLPFNFGYLLLPLFGYLLRDWSHFQIAISLPSAFMIIFYWTLPESPRWLLAIGNNEEATKVLVKAAKMNKLPSEEIESNVIKFQNSGVVKKTPKGTVADLVRTPNIRKNALRMGFSWMVCGFGYFGVTQYVGELGGDIFINVAVSAAAIIPGTILSIPIMKAMGRWTVLISCFFVTSISLFILAAIPESYNEGKVIMAVIGGVAIFVAFIVIYLYASEIFPTVIRSAGIGFSSMLSRVGSMIAPFVAKMDTAHSWISPVIFGVIPFIGILVCWGLPETKGTELPTTVEDGEKFGKK